MLLTRQCSRMKGGIRDVQRRKQKDDSDTRSLPCGVGWMCRSCQAKGECARSEATARARSTVEYATSGSRVASVNAAGNDF